MEPPTSASAFQQRLEAVVTAAVAGGVDVEGSWPVAVGASGRRSGDVEIVRLASR